MNSYTYDSSALASLISSLERQLDEYKATVKNILTLKTTIENSNDWIQELVKSPFIYKCDEYITYFNNTITKLEAHINYLKQKNITMESLEEAYS